MNKAQTNLFGLLRVLSPAGVFPQAAERLDTVLPLYIDETLIEVRRLHLDSASFHQLKGQLQNDPQKIAQRILEITRERGKMENPVTGSGGMLVGKVVQKGEKSPHPFKIGEEVATLVSLTLTPLYLEEIRSIDMKRGEVEVKGYAILFASGCAAPLPQDIPESVGLSILDVCGAPAWVRKKISLQDRVLILGTGNSGILSACAAFEVVGKENVWLVDLDPEPLERAMHVGVAENAIQADARDPINFLKALEKRGAPTFDFVVNTCNVPETEMATILATRPGGKILFFNMATQFSRAVLSAEGIGREVEMVMGNGYAEGHWKEALELVRRHGKLREFFINKSAESNIEHRTSNIV